MHRSLGLIILFSASACMTGCAAGTSPARTGPWIPVTPRSGARAGPPGAYRWTSRYPAGVGGSRGIVVREVLEGGDRMLCAQTLGDGRGEVAVMSGPGGQEFFFDALGSWDIHVEIDRAVGSTTYCGLTFRVPCAVEILDDGTVLVDSEGLAVIDQGGGAWTSRGADAAGVEVIAFFPR